MARPYHVKASPTARKQILALSAKHQKLIIRVAETLAINPRPPGVKKIEGMIGLYSEPINNHRIIYKIEDQTVLLLLIK